MIKAFLVLIEVSEHDPAPSAAAIKGALDEGCQSFKDNNPEAYPDLENISDIHVIDLGRSC